MKFMKIVADGKYCGFECFAYACSGYCPIYECKLDIERNRDVSRFRRSFKCIGENLPSFNIRVKVENRQDY